MEIPKKIRLGSQDGFVSIIVTLIMIIVITIIVLAFAQLSRREQRAALDRHLSTQAFYAAESGINDLAASILANPGGYFTLNPSNTDCATTSSIPGLNPVIDSNSKVEYTCVLYNTQLPDIRKEGITSEKVTLIPISNSVGLTRISISWWNDSGDTSFGTGPAGKFTTQSNWTGDAGVLRVMLIPRGNINRLSYMGNTFHGYLYPVDGPSTMNTVTYASGYGFDNSGVIVSSNCNTDPTRLTDPARLYPYYCNAQITGLTAPQPRGWLLAIRSIYRDSDIVIDCFNGLTNIDCLGGQAQIDVTGKANDVTRRVSVRKNVLPDTNGALPLGFQSVDSICKQIMITPPQVEELNPSACPSF